MKFTHTVSKGSRYNQIYIPRENEDEFEVGDMVEVRLVEKKNALHYSPHLKNLSGFKERLIRELFSFLSKFKEIEQVFIFGSFLTKQIDYHDIDILAFVNKESEDLDKIILDSLAVEFNLKFHLLTATKEGFTKALRFGPIERAMLYHFVSNKPFTIPRKTETSENSIKTLLMMPEDLFRGRFENGKVFYNSLRKTITIENFLKGKEISPESIDDHIITLIGEKDFRILKEDQYVNNILHKTLKGIFKDKLNHIHTPLKNGKKR